MLKELKITLVIFGLLTLLTGVAYPGVVWMVAQLAMPERATGSVIRCATSHSKGNMPTRPSLAGEPRASPIVALRSPATVHELREYLR